MNSTGTLNGVYGIFQGYHANFASSVYANLYRGGKIIATSAESLTNQHFPVDATISFFSGMQVLVGDEIEIVLHDQTDPNGQQYFYSKNYLKNPDYLNHAWALQQAVGTQAGSYLYENAVTTTDANGNAATRYFVGIYTNGPDGSGSAFEKVNSVAGELAPIINDTKNVQLAVLPAGTRVTDDLGKSSVLSGRSPAVTSIFGGNLRINLVDPSTTLQPLPGIMMSNQQPGEVTPGIVAGHELGHARAVMTGAWPNQSIDSSLRLENKARRVKDPGAAQRLIHDCPPGACQ